MAMSMSSNANNISKTKIMTDYQQIYDNIVNSVSDYLKDNDLKAMVLGISGGIDSTVVAAICRIVSNETHIPLIGVSLPTVTNKGCEVSTASIVGREFCDEFSEIRMGPCYDAVSAFCGRMPVDGYLNSIAEGNIKARLRMIALYHIASIRHGIVMDTDNLTEFALGFFTIHGDQGDLSPISLLWKHEVYEFAQWLLDNVFQGSKGLEMSMALKPTDGNGVTDTDMDQIAPCFHSLTYCDIDMEQNDPNLTYDDVDIVLQKFIATDNMADKVRIINQLRGLQEGMALDVPYKKKTVNSILSRHLYTEFKRWHGPLQVDIYNGGIIDCGGKPYKPLIDMVRQQE